MLLLCCYCEYGTVTKILDDPQEYLKYFKKYSDPYSYWYSYKHQDLHQEPKGHALLYGTHRVLGGRPGADRQHGRVLGARPPAKVQPGQLHLLSRCLGLAEAALKF